MAAARPFPLLLLAALALPGCGGNAPLSLNGLSMGTSWEARFADLPACGGPDELRRTILQVLDRVDRSMSTYRPDSDLSRFNAATDGAWHELPPELFDVLAEGRAAAELSGGAFDLSIGPVARLWGFGAGAGARRVPDADELAAARAISGYRLLELDTARRAARKRVPQLRIDVNAIAPGYAVDLIAAELERSGCRNFLVELGGEIAARGAGADGGGWRIGIEQPLPDRRSVARVIRLSDAGLSTSGEYRDFFEQDGVRYGHSIDPASGRPVTHDTVSVSVIHAATVRADALATALLVLGAERGYVLAARQDIAALFIMQRNGELVELPSPAFAALQ